MKNYLTLLLIMTVVSGKIDAAEPTDVVRNTVAEVLGALVEFDETPDRKWRLIAEVISPTFDFKSLSQSSIESGWKEASSQDKQKLIDYFSQYLEDIYRTKMSGFMPSKIDYISEQIRKERSIVDSLVHGPGKKYLVSYRLKKKESNWYIYDIFIDDESVVDNWKEVFGAIIRAEGLDGLLDKLELTFDDANENANKVFGMPVSGDENKRGSD